MFCQEPRVARRRVLRGMAQKMQTSRNAKAVWRPPTARDKTRAASVYVSSAELRNSQTRIAPIIPPKLARMVGTRRMIPKNEAGLMFSVRRSPR